MLPELEGVVTRLVLEAWGYNLTAEDIVDYVCMRCAATPSEVVIIIDALYAEMRD